MGGDFTAKGVSGMGTLKFTDIELKQLVRKGLSLRDMARHLGVSKSTVCVRLKALNIVVSRDVAIRSARKIVDREINAIDQLQKINRDANDCLTVACTGIGAMGQATGFELRVTGQKPIFDPAPGNPIVPFGQVARAPSKVRPGINSGTPANSL